MKKLLLKIKSIHNATNKKGFVIPFSLFISTIILTISMGISLILVKEIFFSKLNRESITAYYAADEALDCALHIDAKYVDPDSGNGIFPYSTPNDAQTTLDNLIIANLIPQGTTLPSIVCGTVPIFDNAITSYSSTGKITEYNMNMDLGGGNQRCAHVKVDKTNGVTITAIGYNNCNVNSPNRVERMLERKL